MSRDHRYIVAGGFNTEVASAGTKKTSSGIYSNKFKVIQSYLRVYHLPALYGIDFIVIAAPSLPISPDQLHQPHLSIPRLLSIGDGS